MNSKNSDIMQELNHHGKALKQKYYSTLSDTYDLKVNTLGGNTARAFHFGTCYTKYQPSSIYKYWLHHKYLGNSNTIKLLKQGTDFEVIHSQAVEKLQRFWMRTEPEIEKMDYYYFAKMIDLFFKAIPRWNELTKRRKEWFFKRVHVPIDQYSLQVLNEYHPDYNIGKQSMNFIGNDKKRYMQVQADIRQLIKPFPPLLFDLFAWDHLRIQQSRDNAKFELIPHKKK